ncbi:MAG TPA: hypothetical protein VKT77_19405 [Chthonomonadaceae bacterium]|nr:hypothetical protein [Chthonomonadaceae bacterium]
MPYRLLTEFESLFRGRAYLHRNSTQGDLLSIQLYEDLVALGKSDKLQARIASKEWALNAGNRRQGVAARRGDGTFGEIVPGNLPQAPVGFRVARGIIATVEIGIEVKILAKAMIKQIDRVCSDFAKQVQHFRHGSDNPICVAVVVVNQAPHTVSYEGERSYRTDGKSHRHPAQEAAEAERRIRAAIATVYDELLILHYSATNEAPFDFEWANLETTTRDYGAALVRISREYERRF